MRGGSAPPQGWTFGEDSAHKVIVYFKDNPGKARLFYSRSWRHKRGSYDEDLGLKRLRKRITEVWKDQAETATIYTSPGLRMRGDPVEKYYEGKPIPLE